MGLGYKQGGQARPFCYTQMRREIQYTVDRWEGGPSNHHADKGGLTKYGISKRAHPDVDIASLTEYQAEAIYMQHYFQPMRCGEIHSLRVRWKVFDMGVNLGPKKAATLVQNAAGSIEDGLIGPNTLARLNTLASSPTGEHALLFRICRNLALHYAKIVRHDPTQAVFIVGWTERAFDIGDTL